MFQETRCKDNIFCAYTRKICADFNKHLAFIAIIEHKFNDMDYKDEKICERIEIIMREKGLTRAALAEEVKIAQSTVSAILNMRRPPMPLIEKMCSFYGINKSWILTGGGAKYNSNDVKLDNNIASLQNLSIEERAKMINDINQLYKRHQDLLAEASEVMKQIVELNKSLLLSNA